MAQWLSWLERRPVTAEVESSNLFWVATFKSCRVYAAAFFVEQGETQGDGPFETQKDRPPVFHFLGQWGRFSVSH